MAGYNILNMFGHILYNSCRNFEWQMCDLARSPSISIHLPRVADVRPRSISCDPRAS